MTDSVHLLRRVGRVIGNAAYSLVRPWPVQPLAALPMGLLFIIWTGGIAALSSAVNVPSPTLLAAAASVVVPLALLMGAYYVSWRIYGPNRAPPWPVYYLMVVGVAAASAVLRLGLLGADARELQEVVVGGLVTSLSVLVSVIRISVALLLINAVYGRVTARLREQVLATEQALEVAKEQQRRLVQADEATRAQVAHDLHDQIQSPLVLIGMQLEQVARNSDAETGDQLRSIADEVEYVRGERLHDVIEGLAPDYGLVGLREALDGLMARYDRALTIRLELQDHAVADVERDLAWVEAVYRITEQALMNAAVHGDAQTVTVTLAGGRDGVRLTIADDGRGLGSDSVGLGTAITDAWAQQTGGEWSRKAMESGGVAVEVSWAK